MCSVFSENQSTVCMECSFWDSHLMGHVGLKVGLQIQVPNSCIALLLFKYFTSITTVDFFGSYTQQFKWILNLGILAKCQHNSVYKHYSHCPQQQKKTKKKCVSVENLGNLSQRRKPRFVSWKTKLVEVQKTGQTGWLIVYRR